MFPMNIYENIFSQPMIDPSAYAQQQQMAYPNHHMSQMQPSFAELQRRIYDLEYGLHRALASRPAVSALKS
jgi:hypothetical protein